MNIQVIGKKFGKLTALRENGRSDRGILIECLCECGNIFVVAAKELRSGNNKSCGCLVLTHGMTGSRPYMIWQNMKKRCNNVNNPDFKRYGGRGISYDSRWESFELFWSDMNNGYSDELTLDRFDVNGNYTKENCRWVTRKVQNNNKRNNNTYLIDGESLTLPQIAEKFKLDYSLLNTRIKRGWSIEEAIATPKEELETITYDNTTKTVVDWASDMGLTYHQLKKRLMRGWDIEKALTQPLKKRSK